MIAESLKPGASVAMVAQRYGVNANLLFTWRRQEPAAIEALFVDLLLEAHDRPPQQIILDLDATDDPLHGDQEGRFFHGYYDCYCYLPLYVFCGRHLLAAKLRPSNIDASAGSVEDWRASSRRFAGVGRERASCCAPTLGSPARR
jgi:hypothetical protein